MKRALDFVAKGSDYPIDSKEFLIWQCLLFNKSFQLPATAEFDRWVGFRVLYSTLKRMLKKDKNFFKLGTGTTLLLFNVQGNLNKTIDYIERFSLKKIDYVVMRGNIEGYKRPYSILDLLRFIAVATSISFKCIFNKKNRANRALLIKEIFEIDTVLWLIKQNAITEIFDFLPYEKDANLLSHLAALEGVKMTFVPSLNPLKDHNHTMLADDIVLVTPYQREEFSRLFSKTIRCRQFLKWPPEGAYNSFEQYSNQAQSEASSLLGFYSHGSWVRKDEAHQGAENVLKQEEWLLQNLNTFLKSRNDISVMIFLHPREKKKNIEAVRNYYRHFLGDHFELAPLEMRSVDGLNLVSVGIAAYSSIVYERLYCGFKMLFAGERQDDFPLENSTLSGIFCTSFSELATKLDKAFTQSGEDFIKDYNLEEYHYRNYQKDRASEKMDKQ
jgi:hypothetical protein